MRQSIGLVTLVVRDYDEAIEYFTGKLHFKLLEDAERGGGKRCVVVSPPASRGTSLLLARAVGAEQEAAIGYQTGGRVFLFLNTDDFWRDYRAMVSSGVKFLEKPREEEYGMVVVFQDLYGNKWDLLQMNDS